MRSATRSSASPKTEGTAWLDGHLTDTVWRRCWMRPSDLTQHECVGFPKAGKWTLHRGAATIEVEAGGRFLVNSIGMIRRLGHLDQGVILVPEEIATNDMAAGRLRHILPEWQGTPTPVYALTETRLLPAKTRRFIEFLQERLGEPVETVRP